MHTIPATHSLYLMGDYHQNPVQLTENLKTMPANASVIILGDYDAHQAQDLVDLSELAEEYQVVMYLMRGNHDNPQYWQNREFSELLKTPWFHLLEDVDLIEYRDLKLMSVSGAVSVDRTCLRFDNGNCWPKEEGIPKDSIQKVKELGECDILLTHTGIIDGMTVKNDFVNSYASTDENLISDIKEERKLVQKLQISSGCSRHYFGHFHQRWSGEQFGVDVRCLDICEVIPLVSL